ncbi:unnamed protein product [Durusdinium trenchii]|uniref:Uncharacterized protein n=1 Tax=Durusdinium trenchii TaxID=1381693 RepID=A0ABP0MPK3_9DINO
MVLRTYFWSIPFSKQGKVRFSVALTNEMFLPLPIDFDLEISLVENGRCLEGLVLKDLKVTMHENCGGVEAEVEGALPREVEGATDLRLLVTTSSWPSESSGSRVGEDRSRSRSPRNRFARDLEVRCSADFESKSFLRHLSPVERLGSDMATLTCKMADWNAALSCLSMPLTGNREDEHSFRCFELGGQILRIREEISSEDMPTGGRLWDAGIALAHWLAAKDNDRSRLVGKTILELGSGCGLPGIVAAHVLGGHIFFSDKKAVLPLTALNVAAHCQDLQTSIMELDWGLEEHRLNALQRLDGSSFDVVLMSDLCYTTSALPKLKDTVLQLTRPNAMLVLAHKVRSEERNHENPMKALQPWFDVCLQKTFGPCDAEVLLFIMERTR